jgi:hypothetical protein
VNPYWALTATVLGVMLLAYCTYSTDRATQDIDRAFESIDQEACCAAGYNAGLSGRQQASGPDDNEDCARGFEAGFAQGRQTYRAYQGVLD